MSRVPLGILCSPTAAEAHAQRWQWAPTSPPAAHLSQATRRPPAGSASAMAMLLYPVNTPTSMMRLAPRVCRGWQGGQGGTMSSLAGLRAGGGTPQQWSAGWRRHAGSAWASGRMLHVHVCMQAWVETRPLNPHLDQPGHEGPLLRADLHARPRGKLRSGVGPQRLQHRRLARVLQAGGAGGRGASRLAAACTWSVPCRHAQACLGQAPTAASSLPAAGTDTGGGPCGGR